MDELKNQAEDPKDPYKEIPIKDFSYVNNHEVSKTKGSKLPLIIVSCLILLVLIAGGSYLLIKHNPKKTPPSKSSNSSSRVVNKQASNGPLVFLSSASKNYSSTGFNLSVNYPDSWTVTDNNTTSLIFTSPVVSLTLDLDKSVPAKVVVSVLPQGQLPAAFGTSGSVAVLASQQFSYSSPTQAQIGKAYVSFVQYPATTVLGGLDGIYITGNDGYVKDQTIPNSDVSAVNPLVVVSFESCGTSTCTSQTPLTISSKMWSDTNFSSTLLGILKSFAFN